MEELLSKKIGSREYEVPSLGSIEDVELLGNEFPVSPSGTHVIYPEDEIDSINSPFNIIRSVVMDADGNLNIDSFMNEIFSGYYSDSIEYVGLPSTVVLNNSNVIMASQIFDRPFEKDFNDGLYDRVVNIQEYFSLRKEKAYHLTGKAPVVTWIGSPSVIFNYQNRIELNKILGSSGLNMIFWLTSFNSTACIVNANVSQYKYCNRFQKIKTLCNDKDSYQIHATYSNFISENDRFITKFEDALDAIHNEQLAIQEYNSEHSSNFYQRYNEMVTYFFPWDISGIEIGMTHPNNIKNLADTILIQKEIYARRYLQLIEMNSSETLKLYFNRLIKNYIRNPKRNKLIEFGYSSPDILFCRFLLFCKCVSTLKFSGDQLRDALIYIIEKLREPLQIKEYVINNITRNGVFVFKGLYNGNPDIFVRETDFLLFTQNKSVIIPKLTQVSPVVVPFFSLDQGRGFHIRKHVLKLSKKNLKKKRKSRKNRSIKRKKI